MKRAEKSPGCQDTIERKCTVPGRTAGLRGRIPLTQKIRGCLPHKTIGYWNFQQQMYEGCQPAYRPGRELQPVLWKKNVSYRTPHFYEQRRSIPLRFISLTGFALCPEITGGQCLRKRRTAPCYLWEHCSLHRKYYTITASEILFVFQSAIKITGYGGGCTVFEDTREKENFALCFPRMAI